MIISNFAKYRERVCGDCKNTSPNLARRFLFWEFERDHLYFCTLPALCRHLGAKEDFVRLRWSAALS
jgi:hypothetical protein